MASFLLQAPCYTGVSSYARVQLRLAFPACLFYSSPLTAAAGPTEYLSGGAALVPLQFAFAQRCSSNDR